MRSLIQYLWKFKGSVLLGLLALVLVDAAGLVTPLVVRQAIDGLAAHREVPLWVFGLVILGLAIGSIVFRFFWRFFLVGAARRIERELRSNFYAQLLKLSTPYYTRTKTGDLMAHATNDMDAVMRACGFGVLTLADAIIMTTTALSFMLAIHWQLTLLAILPLPFVCLVVLGFGRLIHKRFERVQEVFSLLMEKVREALSGIRVVKSFVQEQGMERDYGHTNRQFVSVNMGLAKVAGLFDPSIAFLSGLGTAIVLWAGGQRVISGMISLGDFVALNSYLNMLVWPMMALGFMVNLLQRGAASMKRLNKILDLKPEIASWPRPKPFPQQAGIAFRRLDFSYLPGAPVLRNVNVELTHGQTLGIVGPVGAGKSTLVHLIPRLFDPPAGTVFYGGVDVRQLELHQLRRHIGMVPQDPFLFSATARDNIRFGNPGAQDRQVVQAAQLAGIYEELKALPHGLDTMVGERGVSLSGGQKQRMAIARALLVDPALLILDDCLSAVDAEKEEEILGNLRLVLKDRTAIIIAHRISAVQESDWIIVLDEAGRIGEQGSHEQLVRGDGFYRHLHRLQQAQRTLEASPQRVPL